MIPARTCFLLASKRTIVLKPLLDFIVLKPLLDFGAIGSVDHVGKATFASAVAKGDGHHDDEEHHEYFHGVPIEPNPGPQITFDYFPVPCKPYKPVYDELQRKFNLWLLGGLSFFLFSLYMIYATDATEYEAWARVKSWRDRKRINAELRAKEAAEGKEE
uniref:Deltamethrin resistance protein prag01 domain-containing protein n=1 Tax=Meloidogyne javanica TaxID=6303 RepID=A0A915MZI9_MELJA